MGVLLAGGLVFTQSAFKPAVDNTKETVVYGYDPSSATPWVAEGTEGYNCDRSAKICKYRFSTPPSNNIPITSPLDGTPVNNGEDDLGSYKFSD